MNENEAPKADLVFLKKFSKGDNSIVIKYLIIFLRSNPLLIDSLEKEIKQKDWTSVENTAHSLKTQFNFIGFHFGEKIARQIRNNIEQEKNLDDLPGYIVQLNRICVALKNQLEMEIKSLE